MARKNDFEFGTITLFLLIGVFSAFMTAVFVSVEVDQEAIHRCSAQGKIVAGEMFNRTCKTQKELEK